MLNYGMISMTLSRKINSDRIDDKVFELFISGEEFLYGFASTEEQAIFTNKRIIIITHVPSICEGNLEYYTLAYSQVTNFRITTTECPGDNHIWFELKIDTKDKKHADFWFMEKCDIFLIGKKISEFVLK